uniref:Uncharacterized protein n=1 Tax=Oryza punctata TaxID=4537 RepID=A0A0E0KCG6_ORYPU
MTCMVSSSFRRSRDSPWTVHFCGAHAAVESFESRARIKMAKRGSGFFPTLSIQHLIDILRDQLDHAPNLNQKRLVMMEENAFKILKTIGVTTKKAYDAAPPGSGFVKNVEGVPHYRIYDYRVIYMKSNYWHEAKSSMLSMGEVQCMDRWFVYDDSFKDAKGRNLSCPIRSCQAIDRDLPDRPNPCPTSLRFGAQGRTGLFDYQDNWGPEYHNGGRGIMESANIIGVIVPDVTTTGIAFEDR